MSQLIRPVFSTVKPSWSRIPQLQVLLNNSCHRNIGWKVSRNCDKPLTYEQFVLPENIGVRKSWNSLNNTHMADIRIAETVHEDTFIRMFVRGTFPKLIAGETIIRRRANMIILSFMIVRRMDLPKIYFLLGYTEEILSYILKCPVKIEPQSIRHEDELVYKYV